MTGSRKQTFLGAQPANGEQEKIEIVGFNPALPVAEIVIVGFNPCARTEPRAIALLEQDMARRGYLIEPVAVNEKNHLGDGHRRVFVAIALGWSTVPAVIFRGDAWEYFKVKNGIQRAMRPGDWIQSIAKGMDVPEFRPDLARPIARIKYLLGQSGLDLLAEKHMSPAVMGTALSIAKYCGDDTDAFQAKALRWLLSRKRGQQYAIRRAFKAETDPAVIRSVIESDCDLEERTIYAAMPQEDTHASR